VRSHKRDRCGARRANEMQSHRRWPDDRAVPCPRRTRRLRKAAQCRERWQPSRSKGRSQRPAPPIRSTTRRPGPRRPARSSFPNLQPALPSAHIANGFRSLNAMTEINRRSIFVTFQMLRGNVLPAARQFLPETDRSPDVRGGHVAADRHGEIHSRRRIQQKTQPQRLLTPLMRVSA